MPSTAASDDFYVEAERLRSFFDVCRTFRVFFEMWLHQPTNYFPQNDWQSICRSGARLMDVMVEILRLLPACMGSQHANHAFLMELVDKMDYIVRFAVAVYILISDQYISSMQQK